MQILGARMLERMGQLNLTTRQLAALVGTHYNTIHGYIVAKNEPSASRLAEIAVALEVSADWLLGLTDVQNTL